MLAAAPLIDPIVFSTHHATERVVALGSYATGEGDFAEVKSKIAIIEILAVELGERRQRAIDLLGGG